MHSDPESAKKTDNLTVFLHFWNLRAIKTAHRMLMKLTPGYLFDDTIFICRICDIFLYCQFLTNNLFNASVVLH